ncbi:FK506 binding protein proline rotamase rapamycin-binding protein [Lunasporangiospora selenospora]|uniref:peptidylprolyl isomerase n=1 Tax=Lunasporangiospora selenospora TaxID=979761 RepID=A0A9P6G2U7_9FUNG|nr:FK506 binding protein proline rotamase rapamycin-binding protein [Lunasporangiospora selenospora]
MGVTKTIIKAGDGVNFPKAGDTVHIHYVGTLTNGKKFDSSRDRNEIFVTEIGVGKVIRGWEEGVPLMSLEEIAVLDITSDFGYGDQGAGSLIPPKADLRFEVELIQIDRAPKNKA